MEVFSIPECKRRICAFRDLSKSESQPFLSLQSEAQHCIFHSLDQGHSTSTSSAKSLLSYIAQSPKFLWSESLFVLCIGVRLGSKWNFQYCLLPIDFLSLCIVKQIPLTQNHLHIQPQMQTFGLCLHIWQKMILQWWWKCKWDWKMNLCNKQSSKSPEKFLCSIFQRMHKTVLSMLKFESYTWWNFVAALEISLEALQHPRSLPVLIFIHSIRENL